MRARIVHWLTALVLVVLVATAAAIVPAQQASAQGTVVAGTWTMTSGSGGGDFELINGIPTITSGNFTCVLTYAGAISGTFGAFTLTYNPDSQKFEGYSGIAGATMTVGESTYNAEYFASGIGQDVSIDPVNGTFSFTPVGGAVGGTLAGEADDWFMEGASTGGNGSGDFAITGPTTWTVSNVEVPDGTWSGYAYHLAGPPQIDVVPDHSNGMTYLSVGGQMVALAYHPYSPTAGAIGIFQYADNPGPTMPGLDLGIYIDFTTNIPAATWSGPVQVRIYYTDEQVAAAGIDESTLAMYCHIGSAWVQCLGTFADTVNNIVYATVDHFSVYAVGGSPAPTQVSATVTLQSISVTISEGYPTAVDYGPMELGAEAVPVTYTPSTYAYLQVKNNGSIAEDLLVKGADAICGAGTWTLASTVGADQYSHLFGVGQTPTTYSALSTTASTLGTGVAVGGTVDFNLKIQTPISSTVWGQYSTTVSVLAIAS